MQRRPDRVMLDFAFACYAPAGAERVPVAMLVRRAPGPICAGPWEGIDAAGGDLRGTQRVVLAGTSEARSVSPQARRGSLRSHLIPAPDMTITFRPAITADLDALVAIDSWRTRYPGREQAIAEWLATGTTVVAEIEGKVVAYAVMRPIFFLQPFVEALMVDPSQRRSGIARAMLHHLDTLHGRPKLWVSTNKSNLAMQGLIRSEGFTFAGEIEGVDEGDPELFYYRLRSA
jgi:ribosomal protein S18 acetylase RimI-like enzyme